MKVTHVALQPTESSQSAGRPALTPELLAACGARYSRNNEGLEAILSKIDPSNLDKSVDSIFKMVDYGHQSIADMAPVAMFIDGISLWMAYAVWGRVPTAGGQESSTRYLRLGKDDLIDPAVLGIAPSEQTTWKFLMSESLKAYDSAIAAWEELGEAQPELTRISRSLLEDPSEKAQKAVARMRRNYAFDRARYFLPVGLATNMMLVMSARAWVQLCQWLLSSPVAEAKQLGNHVVEELGLVAPRLLRHAVKTESFAQGWQMELDSAKSESRHRELAEGEAIDAPTLEIHTPSDVKEADIVHALSAHPHRYSYYGEPLARTGVRFGWDAVALAELRDLNRHRTGTKYCPPVARGFYCALDEAPAGSKVAELVKHLSHHGTSTNSLSRRALESNDPTFPYWLLLGTQFRFEHFTTADKFIYEAELRTGLGAHYRYAKHLRDSLGLWYQRFPQTRGMIHEGAAEPE